VYACVYRGSLPKCEDVGVLTQMFDLAQAKAASKEKGSGVAKSSVKPAAQEPRHILAGNFATFDGAAMGDPHTHTQRGQTDEEQGQKDKDKDEDNDESCPLALSNSRGHLEIHVCAYVRSCMHVLVCGCHYCFAVFLGITLVV